MATEVLSVRSTARRLGLCEKTVRRRIRDGSIVAIRLGGRVLVPREALNRLLAPSPPELPEARHRG